MTMNIHLQTTLVFNREEQCSTLQSLAHILVQSLRKLAVKAPR